MLIRLLLTLCAMLLPLSAQAQTLVGSWDLRIDGVTVFRFDIAEGQDGEWLGQWHRPERFNSDGNAFYNMRGGIKTSPSMTGIVFLGMVELAFDDPRPGAIPDIFRFRQTGPDSAEMTYVGTGLAPYAIVRAAADARIGNWDATHRYSRVVPGSVAAPPVVSPLPAPGPAPAPVEEPAPEAPEAPEAPAPVSRIGRDFLEGL